MMTTDKLNSALRIAEKAVVPDKASLVVYSAVIGGYDDPPLVNFDQPSDVRLVCFSDRDIVNSGPWEIVKVDAESVGARAQAKVYKLFPHVLFPYMGASIWLDGTFEVIGDLERMAELAFSDGSKMALFSHPSRDCAYAEGHACRRLQKDDPVVIEQQMALYRKNGFPEKMGLLFGGVLFRRHRDPLVIAAMEAWWQEVSQFSMRDQLSFNYIAWRMRFPFRVLPGEIYSNDFLKWGAHKGSMSNRKCAFMRRAWRLLYRIDSAFKRMFRKLCRVYSK